MHRLIITKIAEKQLEQIADWTLKNWGRAQVDTYKLALEMGLLTLIENPLIGQNADNIRQHLRKFLVEEHWGIL